MTEYDNTNRGVLFQNQKAKDTQPDYKGSINIEGKEYWLSGWKKLSKSNEPFLSLSVQPKQEVEERGDNSAKAEMKLDTDEPISLDDIPF